MRLHITLADDIVADLDRRVGARRRSAFIAQAIRMALDDERRWEAIQSSLGSIEDGTHDWDADPAGWVRDGRRGDAARVG